MISHQIERQAQTFVRMRILHQPCLENAVTNINHSKSASPALRSDQSCGLLSDHKMADYNFGGSDEENAELKKLNAEVVS